MSDKVDEFSGAATKIYNSIDKMIVVKGLLCDDPIRWELHTMGKVLKIPAEKIENLGYFRAEYIRAFDCPAPKIKSEDWILILQALATDKKEVITEVEESDNVYFAREVFEEIRKMPISDDEESALLGRCLLDKNGMYWIIAKKIKEILDCNKYNITANRLSPVMTQLGLKKESTDNLTLNHVKNIRVWGFYPENFGLSETKS